MRIIQHIFNFFQWNESIKTRGKTNAKEQLCQSYRNISAEQNIFLFACVIYIQWFFIKINLLQRKDPKKKIKEIH